MPKESELAAILAATSTGDKTHGGCRDLELKDPAAGAKSEIITEEVEPEREEFRPIAVPEEYHLPAEYGDDIIVLQVRDPYWLHTYWEITNELKESIIQRIGLEAYNHSSWILRVYDVTDGSLEYYDIGIGGEATDWYINVGKPDRTYKVDVGLLTPNSEFISLVSSNPVHTPRDGFSHIIDEEWMSIEEEYQRLYRLAIGYGIGESSVELVESILERHRREMGSAALQGISSPIKWQGGLGLPKPFWLTVHTELIVYGATEPGAKVTVQGNLVEVRPDGTFTLRFALPDGQEVIPVKASSHDDQEITITPVVKKWTTNG
jgi:hypothetical protein